MTHTEHLLTILSEECIETAQRVSKAIRFGLEEVQPSQPLTNAERIMYEFHDILAVVEVLQGQGLLPAGKDLLAIHAKKEKIAKYMAYAEQCGTIN